MEKSGQDPGKGHTPPPAQSKVREYILDMKRSDELNRKRGRRKDIGCSLEDLFQVETPDKDLPPAKAQEELRKTLRKVKERDLVILRLRETCHELTLKCAHAENTIDQLRFGRGGGMRKAASMMTLAKEETTPKDTRDQATEMESRVVDILDESCSNWMEKIQNWKTGDSGMVAASCADADSGFRGSELLETSGRRRTGGGAKSSWRGLPLQTSVESSPTSRHNFQTTGTNTEGTRTSDPLEERLPRASHSQSFNDFLSHKSDKSLDKVDSSHVRTDHFKTLDPLLDETTMLAKRIQRKSKKLAKLIQCVDRKT